MANNCGWWWQEIKGVINKQDRVHTIKLIKRAVQKMARATDSAPKPCTLNYFI